jgi:hypothetical protein
MLEGCFFRASVGAKSKVNHMLDGATERRSEGSKTQSPEAQSQVAIGDAPKHAVTHAMEAQAV